jgi:hypothetical protein
VTVSLELMIIQNSNEVLNSVGAFYNFLPYIFIVANQLRGGREIAKMALRWMKCKFPEMTAK